MRRRPICSVIGAAEPSQQAFDIAFDIGRGLVDMGCRVVTGGKGGVMEAACAGAHHSDRYFDGATIGILPDGTPIAANDHVDIIIPSGLGHARNVLVVLTGQVVIAVGGGAGTLSEISIAWQLDRPILGINIDGWSQRLAGSALDDVARPPIAVADSATAAVAWAERHVGRNGA